MRVGNQIKDSLITFSLMERFLFLNKQKFSKFIARKIKNQNNKLRKSSWKNGWLIIGQKNSQEKIEGGKKKTHFRHFKPGKIKI